MSKHDFDWMEFQQEQKEYLLAAGKAKFKGGRVHEAEWVTYRVEDAAMPVCRPIEWGGSASQRNKERDES